MKLMVNDRLVETDSHPGTVVLDFIRGEMHLTGAKEGCREGECGACSVLVGKSVDGKMQYQAVASCLLPLGNLAGRHLVTIEGLNGKELNPVQALFVEENATQCGFCTPGFIISVIGYFLTAEFWDTGNLIRAMDGNICRCTGYASIKRAASRLIDRYKNEPVTSEDRIRLLIDWKILPGYFAEIARRLSEIPSETQTDNVSGSEVIVAGGTDLFVQRPDDLAKSKLLFVSAERELTRIREEDEFLSVGSGVDVEQMRNDPILLKHFPTIGDDLLLVSSTLIRNRATVGGNIVNASPIGGLSVIFLALDANLVIDHREVKLRDFFKAYKQIDLHPGERIRFVKVPIRPERLFHFAKVAQRNHLAIASCNSAMSVVPKDGKLTETHLSAGGVGPVPLYLAETSKAISGKPINADTVRLAVETALSEIKPISDSRGSAEYKTLLLQQQIISHFLELFPRQIGMEDLI